MKTAILCATALGALSLGAQAHAQDPSSGIKIGTLSCHERAGWGFVFGSSHAVRCTFSSGAGRVAHYTGDIAKFGVDVGYQQSGVLIWSVLAPTDDLAPGALQGHYGGLTAGAAVGVGIGANALIGGSTRTVTLQPLSIEGTTGLNIAAGIGDLTLKYQPTVG